MALEDFADPEVGLAIAATALLASPKARNFLRQGAVFGLAALIRAGDAMGNAARGAASGVQQVASDGAQAVQQTTTEARTTPRGKGTRGGSAATSSKERD